jgi:predicted dehydrogenase
MAASKRVGYAIVGLGHIAEHAVLPAFRHSKKSKLVAVASGDAAKARRLAARFHADEYYTYGAFDQCLRNPEVEAVYVTTNNSTHMEFTLQAAAAGKHVLCEKPLANSVEECQRMVDACRKNHVKLMTAYRKYFEPACIELKKLIRSGKLGRLKIIHTAFTINLDPRHTWHLSQRLAGGGSLVDLGVYCVSTVRWLTGLEPVEATAHSWTVDPARFSEVEESTCFQLKFPDGLYVQGSSSFGAALASFLQIYGEKGWAALDPAYVYDDERRMFGEIGGQWFRKRFRRTDEFQLEVDHLSECIRRNRDPLPDGRAGLRDMAVMHAIYQAAQLNQPVPIHLPE